MGGDDVRAAVDDEKGRGIGLGLRVEGRVGRPGAGYLHGDRSRSQIRRRENVDLAGTNEIYVCRLPVQADTDALERGRQLIIHEVGRLPTISRGASSARKDSRGHETRSLDLDPGVG